MNTLPVSRVIGGRPSASLAQIYVPFRLQKCRKPTETSAENANLQATLISEGKELVVEAMYKITVTRRYGDQQVKQLMGHVNLS